MKKRLLISIAALVCLLTWAGCSQQDNSEAVYLDDLVTTDVDMSVYQGFNVADHQFRKLTMKEANRLFAEGGSGILYYGYSSCAWCTQAVPVMNEVVAELGLTIYYVDMYSDDGNTEEVYNTLISYVDDYLQHEDGEAVFYVPQVFVVKNGKVVGDHLSTVESYSPSQGNMTEAQKNELKDIYREMFRKLV